MKMNWMKTMTCRPKQRKLKGQTSTTAGQSRTCLARKQSSQVCSKTLKPCFAVFDQDDSERYYDQERNCNQERSTGKVLIHDRPTRTKILWNDVSLPQEQTIKLYKEGDIVDKCAYAVLTSSIPQITKVKMSGKQGRVQIWLMIAAIFGSYLEHAQGLKYCFV